SGARREDRVRWTWKAPGGGWWAGRRPPRRGAGKLDPGPGRAAAAGKRVPGGAAATDRALRSAAGRGDPGGMRTRRRARRGRILRAEPIRRQRLRLDRLRVDDAAELAGALADPALYRFLGGRAPDEEQLRRRYADLVEGSDEPGVSWCTW